MKTLKMPGSAIAQTAVLSLAIAVSHAMHAEEAKTVKPSANIVVNGDFSKGIEGWADVRSAKVETVEGAATLVLDGANAAASQKIAIDPKWRKLHLTMRMRTKDVAVGGQTWKDARLAMNFNDASGKRAGDWPAVFNASGTTDWKSCEREYDIPAGAATLVISPANFGTAGKVEFQNISIVVKGMRAVESDTVGSTRIAEWKDDKKGAFMLMFDDSIPSHIKNVLPEFKKRGMVGTFYVNPGRGGFDKNLWGKEIPAMGVAEYGNHTMTHAGAKDAAQLDTELAGCDAFILESFPALPKPRLISFARPGGVPWTVSTEEVKQALKKYHLIERPPFKGPPINFKTRDEVIRLVDNAISTGKVEYIVCHGVGGDWLSFPAEDFNAVLDKLDAEKDKVWVATHIQVHKYETERDAAQIGAASADTQRIQFTLTCGADPALYDSPLTLVTRIPAEWGKCKITQGNNTVVADAKDGKVKFDAMPAADKPITITPAK